MTPWTLIRAYPDPNQALSITAVTKAISHVPVRNLRIKGFIQLIWPKGITVETEASDHALATVVLITTPNSELHPIAFHSQTFSAPELNYDMHDKELLAIFEAFKQW